MNEPNDEFRAMYGAALAERIAGIAGDERTDEAARKDERERAEAERMGRHMRLVDSIQAVLRGGLGRRKEAADAIAAIQRVLAGSQPRQAEMAQLVLCESIIREAKERIRKSKTPSSGRGAP